MSRIPQLDPTTTVGPAKDIFTAIQGKIGTVPNLYRATGNSPVVLNALLNLGDNLGKGLLNGKEREAIALAVAGVNGCNYCASAHTAIVGGMGVSKEEAGKQLLGQASDPRTQALIALAVKIVNTKGFVADADLLAAREAGLVDGEIVEVVANVAANIFTNYLNHVIDTDIDFPKVTVGGLAR